VQSICQLPLALAARTSRVWPAIERDVERVVQPRLDQPMREVNTRDLLRACAHRPFRTILYTRLRYSGLTGRAAQRMLRPFFRGQILLELECGDIGPGLYMWHGYGTVCHALSIGVDCEIGQLVTIGYSDRGGPPTLGDRVRIGPCATLLGAITIGDGAVVGANSVVLKDVPPGTVVGGVPARPLRRSDPDAGAPSARVDEDPLA
jgi:serine O-acetyltransferase